MASTNAQKCLTYFPESVTSAQHLLIWALLKMLANMGTDNTEPVASDDVISQLEEVFPANHRVLEIVRQELNSVRNALTGGRVA